MKKALKISEIDIGHEEIQIDIIDGIIEQEQMKDIRERKFEKQIKFGAKSLEFEVKTNELSIMTKNITNLEASFFKIDFEILFSKSPFSTTVNCSFIKI